MIPRSWIIGFFAALVLAAETHGYFWGQRVSERRHAVAEAAARTDFMRDDFERQAIEDEIDRLAQQLEDESHVAPIANPAALGVDRVRRVNRLRP